MPNNNYKADVIIPAYNAEHTLGRTLESLCKQTYMLFKIIIINDGSTDNTLDIVSKYRDKLNIDVVDLKYNRGVSNARNVGIENSKSDYILFIDSDDIVDEQYIEHLLSVENDKDFVIIHERKIDDNKKNIGEINEISTNDFKRRCWDLWSEFRILNVWGVRYKRNLIKTYNLKFDTNLKWGEDTKFNIQYLQYCKELVSLPYYEYVYIKNKNSASRKYEVSRFDNSLDVAKTFTNFAQNSDQLWMIKYIYWDMAIRHGINHLYDNDNRIWKKNVIKEIKRAINEPFFRTCIKDVMKKGSLDMKVYAFFLKIRMIRPYIFIARKMNW